MKTVSKLLELTCSGLGERRVLTNRLRSKESRSRSEVAQTLRTLADRVEGNSVTLGQGENQVQLSLPDQLQMKIKVQDKPKGTTTRTELEVELSWDEGAGGELTPALRRSQRARECGHAPE